MSLALPQGLTFSRRVVVYIPVFNCADKIVSVLDDIPQEIWDVAEVLVIDNCSTDDSAEKVLTASKSRPGRPIHLIRPPRNLGYAGSQKLAYSLALESPRVQRVMMLHGDGQYPPQLLKEFLPYLDGDWGVVYGYRLKSGMNGREETPLFTYFTIKALSLLESLITGYRRAEWHSGFVMYSRDFLSRVNLAGLTPSRHIDGHLLFAAGVLGVRTKPVPIYKRYRGYEGLKGWKRLRYVGQVLGLLLRFRAGQDEIALGSGSQTTPLDYSVLTGPSPKA
ncbi:MAG: glycosyltransferase family 2 protein [Deltaproteobacteria bacterium]|nr:glycosyltransferase family 2 protein [Deltaproteobacteria bacterium]